MEQFNYFKRNTGLALGASLLALTGCAGQEQNKVTDTSVDSDTSTSTKVSEKSKYDGDITYYSDGVREIKLFHGLNSTIMQFCDNFDLVELYNGTFQRSVNYKACDDRMLTADDFPYETAE